MSDANRIIDVVNGLRGQHQSLDDLLAELFPDALPDLVREYDGTAGRWEVRKHRVYRFADDSLADLSYSAPLQRDQEAIQPQCSGIVVYAVARQAVEYLTADQRHALGLVERPDYRQPVDHQTEWALCYWEDGNRIGVESVGTGERAERLARGYHAKQSADDQLAATRWDRITLEARDVYLAPWRTIDTPTTGPDQPLPAPRTTGEN